MKYDLSIEKLDEALKLIKNQIYKSKENDVFMVCGQVVDEFTYNYFKQLAEILEGR